MTGVRAVGLRRGALVSWCRVGIWVVPLAVGACGPPRPVAPPVVAPPAAPPAATAPRVPSPTPGPALLPTAVRVQWPGSPAIDVLALEDYVRLAVAGELAIGALPRPVAGRMLEVQAIVSRTWVAAHLRRHAAEGFDVCATTHCQVLRPAHDVLPPHRPPLDAAIAATRGRVIVFDGRPIEALFHANCGGSTRSPRDVWGTDPKPYLRPVPDAGCFHVTDAGWRFRAQRADVRKALNSSARTSVGRQLDAIRVVQRDELGRGVLVALDGERSPIVRGEEVRSVLTRAFGFRSIRSPGFEVVREGELFIFSGRGFGHGVGLCQHGALRRLVDGATVSQVLGTYYPGTTVGVLPVSPDEGQRTRR